MQRLKDDEDLDKAIEVLNSPEKYKEILFGSSESCREAEIGNCKIEDEPSNQIIGKDGISNLKLTHHL